MTLHVKCRIGLQIKWLDRNWRYELWDNAKEWQCKSILNVIKDQVSETVSDLDVEEFISGIKHLFKMENPPHFQQQRVSFCLLKKVLCWYEFSFPFCWIVLKRIALFSCLKIKRSANKKQESVTSDRKENNKARYWIECGYRFAFLFCIIWSWLKDR